MTIQQDVSLREHSTMRLGGTAKFYAEVRTRGDLVSAYKWATGEAIPVRMIGDGSNIVWRDEGYSGLLLVNRMERYEVFGEDEVNVYLTVGAGENWDSVVSRSVDNHLTGIEALSLIPGTVGATPVQNVGAYGQDISQTLVSVEAFDTTTGQLLNIPVEECGFGYRTSRFKTTDEGRFWITAITLHLMRGDMQPPFYAALQKYFDEHGVLDSSPQSVRQAVIAIRQSKLPDPAQVANNGSFFANPIIDSGLYGQLATMYPEMPHWPTDEPGKTKIPAAWLLEQCGYKDYHDPATGMGTWPAQPLVLVNESAQSTTQLLQFRDVILAAVQAKFGISLQQEPELLGDEPTAATEPVIEAPAAPPEAPKPPEPPKPEGPRPDYLDMYNKI